jgi:crossover junction endodeoxyribonuclease RuvC
MFCWLGFKPRKYYGHIQLTRPDYVLGVDPGLRGALCLLDVSDRSITVFDMPVTDGRVDPAKLASIVDLCKIRGEICAAVELVSSMPRQASAFPFGVSAGVVHGVLGALGVPYVLIPPSQWKPAMGLRRMSDETQDQNKTRARELAGKLWPSHTELFRRVKDDGRAESALLGRYHASKNGWIR